MKKYDLVSLIILDGFGYREKWAGNAVAQANTPNFDKWNHDFEMAILDASGEAVGLIPDQMGNSEVGHLNLGAGFVVYQDVTRVDKSIREGTLERHPSLTKAIEYLKKQGKKVHLIGLLGPGGVHSHTSHLFAFLRLFNMNQVTAVVHVITDGRDTPPNSGIGFVKELEDEVAKLPHVKIATLAGRYYTMDRDKRWERIKLGYNAIAFQEGKRFKTASDGVEASYKGNVTDEFIVPCVIGDDSSKVTVESGDCLLFFNFRADRMRQIVRVFTDTDFKGFTDYRHIKGLKVLTLTEYDPAFNAEVLFAQEFVTQPLAKVLSEHGLKQFHAAETEKYPHVTYFFNGRIEQPFPGEDRLLIPSPKVATYDLQPEMSAHQVMDAVLKRVKTDNDNFVLVNFANPDMVGHTGIMAAAMKAVETADYCAGKIVKEVLQKGGVALVTADHGNAERLIDEYTGAPHTYHTTSPVKMFIIANEYINLRPRGILADVAPTILDLMGIKPPTEMTGRTLIEHP